MSIKESDPRLTEERLRTYLDSNQVQRERLCMALLPLLGPYSDVRPRRPKGGRDGGRDVEASLRSSTVVWGAVGFRNQASDSPADKKWVKQKFKADLEAAILQNPSLTAFVFFTNVDLTPSEIKTLRGFAAPKGVGEVEIFYRERLRQVLDSLKGLPSRLQYLDLPMTKEEQLSFFNAFGEEVVRFIEQKHSVLDQMLRVLDLRLARLRRLNELMVIVDLDRSYTYDELGHFRILLSIRRSIQGGVIAELGGRDHVLAVRADGDRIERPFGVQSALWKPDQSDVHFLTAEHFTESRKRLIAFANPTNFALSDDLDSLHQCYFELYFTPNLQSRAKSIAVVANRYILSTPSPEMLKKIVWTREVAQWPAPLTASERESPLQAIAIGVFDLERIVPQRVDGSKGTGPPI